MPITNLQLLTVTGKFLLLDGSPAAGTVKFVPSAILVNKLANEVVYPNNFMATLNASGVLNLTLPATDDSNLSPINWAYQVTETITGSGATRVYSLQLPKRIVTPAAPTLTTSPTGGSILAGTQSYRVVATGTSGATLASVATTIVTSGATSTVTINWVVLSGAIGYKIYGRTGGSEQLIATLGDVATYTDTGAIIPSGALPTVNDSIASYDLADIIPSDAVAATSPYVVQATYQGHVAGTADNHPASAVTFAPAGAVSANNVQGAITELDTKKVPTTDSRLSDNRIPTDNSVTGGPAGTGVKIVAGTITDANIAVAAAIAETKLALATDAAAGIGSRRTLGTGALQAAAGNDSRLGAVADGSITGGTAGAGVKIAATTITDANIAVSAAIAKTKLAALAIADADVNTISPGKITGTAVVTADGRLSDARTPTDGSVTGGTAGTGVKIAATTITNANINAAAGIVASKLDSTTFNTQVQTSRLDQMAAPTSSLSANSQKIINLLDPTGAQDAASKNYVDTAPVNVNTQTASYTLALTDNGKVVEMNVATANTLTVPPNSSVALPVGTIIEIHQYGAGQVTLTPGAGVTIRSSGSKLRTTGQYSSASLRKRATDEWVAAGDLVV